MSRQYLTNFKKRFKTFRFFKKTSYRASEQLLSCANVKCMVSFSTVPRYLGLLVDDVRKINLSSETITNKLSAYCGTSKSASVSTFPVSTSRTCSQKKPQNCVSGTGQRPSTPDNKVQSHLMNEVSGKCASLQGLIRLSGYICISLKEEFRKSLSLTVHRASTGLGLVSLL